MKHQKKGQRRALPLSLCMTEGQRSTIRYGAYLSDKTISAFIREAALRAAERLAKTKGAA